MNRKVGFFLGKSRKPPSHWLKERKNVSRYRKKKGLAVRRHNTRAPNSTNQHKQPTDQKTNKGGKEGANRRFLSGRTKATNDVTATPLAPGLPSAITTFDLPFASRITKTGKLQ